MSAWWENLAALNQGFYCAAAFFSVFFVWQLIAVMIGLDHEGADVDGEVAGGDMDHTYDNFEHGAESDAMETVAAFKLLSFRSVITFFTLFTWGTALYLNRGEAFGKAMGISAIWGLAGMLCIALLFYAMKKLTETGNKKLDSCIGRSGTVYLDIPEEGTGEIRIEVSGMVSYVKARTKGGGALKANTPVKAIRRLGQNVVEVEKE